MACDGLIMNQISVLMTLCRKHKGKSVFVVKYLHMLLNQHAFKAIVSELSFTNGLWWFNYELIFCFVDFISQT